MMKCQLNEMNEIHNVLISKQISYKSYKEICSGEKKKVNLGYNWSWWLEVENNSLVHIPRIPEDNIHGTWRSVMSYDFEILSKFFSVHNIDPNLLDCNDTWGWYDEDLGGWTGCMGKVGAS